LEAQNLDTIQAMQIRMNLQQLFAMSARSARRFLERWKAWVEVCDLGPMKKLAKTIMPKSEGILRSIATGLSNGVLEAINGNVQAAKRKAKGYRTKRNLKAIVYLIALSFPSMRQMAPDLLLHPIFDEAEALAGVPNREVVHPT
jgi:transposase